MKVIDTHLLEIGPTPKEIVRMRQQVLDFHLRMGQPVIFKHRWNLGDRQNGLVEECPYHDQSYERSKTNCKYCFGTGFLGGFSEGIIIFATIADAPVDQLKISERGYILYERHPQLTAPWQPLMGDGDLIILGEFDRATWSVLSTSDRFELNEVSPVTIRGFFGDWTDFQLYKVQQTATIDRIPNTHAYYNVPVEFDYEGVPTTLPTIGFDTDLFPYNTFTLRSFKLVGMGGFLSSSNDVSFNVVGAGFADQKTVAFRLNAEDIASNVSFEETLPQSDITINFQIIA